MSTGNSINQNACFRYFSELKKPIPQIRFETTDYFKSYILY
jgi:hypothetical protein